MQTCKDCGYAQVQTTIKVTTNPKSANFGRKFFQCQSPAKHFVGWLPEDPPVPVKDELLHKIDLLISKSDRILACVEPQQYDDFTQ